MSILRNTVFFLLFVLHPTIVNSELSPAVYEQWKAAADEVLVLQVKQINSTGKMQDGNCLTMENYTATAIVMETNRTKNDLMAGDSITVNTYTFYLNETGTCQGFVGPSFPLVPSAGSCYLAYLNETSSTPMSYELAAGGQSLEATACPNGTTTTGSGNNGGSAGMIALPSCSIFFASIFLPLLLVV